MLHSSSRALRTLITDTAIFMLGDTAVVQCVLVGDVGAATDTGVALVCTNVPTNVPSLIIGTLLVVVTLVGVSTYFPVTLLLATLTAHPMTGF